MRQRTRFFVLAFGVAVAAPAAAQSANNDTLGTQVLHMLKDPARWHVSVQGASSSFGTFLLQQTPGGERAIRADRAFAFGGGAGFDIDESNGVRLGYMHTGSGINYRDWAGAGSSALNLNDLGHMSSNSVSLEADHYFLSTRSLISPYAGAGLAGIWSSLDPTTPFLTTPGGSQRFGFGATASFGVQVRVIPQLFSRLEWATQGLSNPWTGNRSWRAPAGVTFDEPSRVSKSEWRLAAVYYLGKQAPGQQATVATSP